MCVPVNPHWLIVCVKYHLVKVGGVIVVRGSSCYRDVVWNIDSLMYKMKTLMVCTVCTMSVNNNINNNNYNNNNNNNNIMIYESLFKIILIVKRVFRDQNPLELALTPHIPYIVFQIQFHFHFQFRPLPLLNEGLGLCWREQLMVGTRKYLWFLIRKIVNKLS